MLTLHFLDKENPLAFENAWKEWSPHRNKENLIAFRQKDLFAEWGHQNIQMIELREDSVSCGTMIVYEHRFQMQQESLQVAGIGSFTILSPFRKKGLGSHFMKKVHQYYEEKGWDGMFLFSEIDANYYQKLGYEIFPQSYQKITLATFSFEGKSDLPASFQIQPMLPKHWKEVNAIYGFEQAKRDWFLVREETYFALKKEKAKWAHQFLGAPLDEWDDMVLLDANQKVVAYFQAEYDETKQRVCISEYGAFATDLATRSSIFSSFLRHFVSLVPKGECKLVTGLFPSSFQKDFDLETEVCERKPTHKMMFHFFPSSKTRLSSKQDFMVWGLDGF